MVMRSIQQGHTCQCDDSWLISLCRFSATRKPPKFCDAFSFGLFNPASYLSTCQFCFSRSDGAIDRRTHYRLKHVSSRNCHLLGPRSSFSPTRFICGLKFSEEMPCVTHCQN